MDNRGRGRGSFTRGRARFLIRKATGDYNAICPKFQVNVEQGGMQKGEIEQDHKRAEVDKENI
uniref:Uncharacterized protein n=2 Tax=Heroini TaxID=318529 RepID=A0A3Q0SJZ4_AMPCI